jgi:hypothetical protein
MLFEIDEYRLQIEGISLPLVKVVVAQQELKPTAMNIF